MLLVGFGSYGRVSYYFRQLCTRDVYALFGVVISGSGRGGGENEEIGGSDIILDANMRG